MQFTTVFTVLATAALAMGAAVPEPGHPAPYPPNPYPPKPSKGHPAPPPPAPTPPSTSGCQTGHASSCCTGVGFFGFNCILNILSNTCSIGSTACCPTNQNGIINFGSICIPITL